MKILFLSTNINKSLWVILLSFLFIIHLELATAQAYKFYYSDKIKVLNVNSDTLHLPFTGGFNAPQFSNIDFDGDKIQDLFVFDRSSNKITVFVSRNGKFIHSPEFEGRFPYVTDWCLLRDYDADGKPDLFSEVSLDLKDYVDTSIRAFKGGVRLFKNISTPGSGLAFKQLTNQLMDTGGIFKDLGLFKDPERINVNATDLPAIDDIDGDSDADILAFQYLGLSPHFFENYMKNKYHLNYNSDSTRYIYRDDCWGYCEYDRTFSRNSFELHISAADMAGDCFFNMYEKNQHAANTFFMIDYNGDGVKDLVYGDGSGGSYMNLVLLLNGRKFNSLGRDSIMAQDTAFPSNTTPANFINFPAGFYVDADGDGVNELLITTNEPISAKSLNNVWYYENNGTTDKPLLDYKGNSFFAYNETIDLGTRSVPSLADIDGDGDLDLVVATNGDFAVTANAMDKLVLFTNGGNVNGNPVFKMTDSNYLSLSKDTPLFSIYPCFADMNGDQKKDLLLGNDRGNILYYRNTGSGYQLETRNYFNIEVGSCAAPAVADMDGDGKSDLLIGNRDGYLKYFRNSGTQSNPQFSSTPTVDTFGQIFVNDSYMDFNGFKVVYQYGYASPNIYDLDGDGKPELLVGSDGGKVYVYSNLSTQAGAIFTQNPGAFSDFSRGTEGRNIRFGKRSAPCIASLDDDQKPDIMIGNLSGGLFYYSSSNTYNPMPDGLEVAEKNHSLFIIYPNPGSGVIHIANKGLDHDASFCIMDGLGQCVKQGRLSKYYSEEEIEIDSTGAGFYFITISTEDRSETHKLIILK